MSDGDFSDVYGISRWGDGYLQQTENGDLALINPFEPDAPPVALPAVIANMEARGIQTPVLIRVASYLKNAIDNLNDSFANAIQSYKYQGDYRGVFPIKVNQQAQVIERIVEYGAEYNFGLEAGSKPELVIALSQKLPENALIVCNGVKDEEFIELAIRSRQIGFNTIIVLESPDELELVIKVSHKLKLEPLLGIRVKLNHRVGGKWAQSSGENSTFGLKINQLVDVIDKLNEVKMLHCLVLQHSHLGSQIPNINDVRRAATEACRVFTSVCAEGAQLKYLDLGGGLGIDYTGLKNNSPNSANYTMSEYCSNLIETVSYAMEEAGLAHPTIITESGRAVVAHSSFLVFSVLDTTTSHRPAMPQLDGDEHHLISDLAAIKDYISNDRLQECFNDAYYYRDELRTLFSFGNISIREMAKAEKIHQHICALIKQNAHGQDDLSDELNENLEQLVDIYHCNFSLFQSLPDIWAIDQIHPIVPLQRLNEEPVNRAILSDITCDSDGKVDRFVTEEGEVSTLPLHEMEPEETYHLGVFFIGAYQETLGDLHNLFGDTNVVTVDFDQQGSVKLLHEVEGDSISDVLSYVEYDPRKCIDAFKQIVEQAVGEGKISAGDRRRLMAAYKDSMNGYTYFENGENN